MSDYQTVRLLKKEGRVLTIDVVEVHPDMATLSTIIQAGSEREGWHKDAVKVAAMVLLDEKGRRGDIARRSYDEPPEPEDFVAAVRVVSAEEIGRDSSGDPQYHAVLELTVTKDEYAAVFAVDETWGAVAYLYGDFDVCFG
ncbi:MAG TPA: hypothetical protein VN903_06210 [Polyangia bacterium]|jgi:hypothetical protein|nr:hypothetical protein [Polyangia bacterium]